MTFQTGHYSDDPLTIHVLDSTDQRPVCRTNTRGDVSAKIQSKHLDEQKVTCKACLQFIEGIKPRLAELEQQKKRLQSLDQERKKLKKKLEQVNSERIRTERQIMNIKYPQQVLNMQTVMAGNAVIIDQLHDHQSRAIIQAWLKDHAGLYQSGHRQIGKNDYQYLFSVKLDRHFALSEQMGIRELLPMIREDKARQKVLQIFEHTLSYHASYSLIVLPEEVCEVREGTRVKFSGTLEEAMQYIYDHHPYCFKKSEHDENDWD